MSPEEKAKADEIYKAIIGKERNSLVKRYGKGVNAERVAKGRAIKIAQKIAEKKMEPSKDKLREMVKNALTGTNEELKGGQKKLDVAEPKGKITAADFAMLRKGKVGEDLDLGHEDNEPHMIKGELYRIGKYAMELYQMVDQFEGKGEVDFPAWWQAKITTAKNMVSSAKHYLEFELREPEIDAMVGVATAEDIIPNVSTEPLEEAQREVMIDGKLVDITTIKPSNISLDDYPDFSDAYAANAQFMDGTELTDEQLSMLDDQYPDVVRNVAEDSLTEKKLTKPELKKREEIAKAMEKGDPKMDMEKKMAIATSIAKKVAERLMAKK
jgi:hypothetical protein